MKMFVLIAPTWKKIHSFARPRMAVISYQWAHHPNRSVLISWYHIISLIPLVRSVPFLFDSNQLDAVWFGSAWLFYSLSVIIASSCCVHGQSYLFSLENVLNESSRQLPYNLTSANGTTEVDLFPDTISNNTRIVVYKNSEYLEGS